jgi:glutathione S-transferase
MSARSRDACEGKVRAADGGPPFAERIPTAEHFERVQQHLMKLGKQYGGNKFLLGNDPTYVDLVVVACLVMLISLITVERQDQVLAVDGGRWRKLLEEFEAAGYLVTDRGENYVPKA